MSSRAQLTHVSHSSSVLVDGCTRDDAYQALEPHVRKLFDEHPTVQRFSDDLWLPATKISDILRHFLPLQFDSNFISPSRNVSQDVLRQTIEWTRYPQSSVITPRTVALFLLEFGLVAYGAKCDTVHESGPGEQSASINGQVLITDANRKHLDAMQGLIPQVQNMFRICQERQDDTAVELKEFAHRLNLCEDEDKSLRGAIRGQGGRESRLNSVASRLEEDIHLSAQRYADEGTALNRNIDKITDRISSATAGLQEQLRSISETLDSHVMMAGSRMQILEDRILQLTDTASTLQPELWHIRDAVTDLKINLMDENFRAERSRYGELQEEQRSPAEFVQARGHDDLLSEVERSLYTHGSTTGHLVAPDSLLLFTQPLPTTFDSVHLAISNSPLSCISLSSPGENVSVDNDINSDIMSGIVPSCDLTPLRSPYLELLPTTSGPQALRTTTLTDSDASLLDIVKPGLNPIVRLPARGADKATGSRIIVCNPPCPRSLICRFNYCRHTSITGCLISTDAKFLATTSTPHQQGQDLPYHSPLCSNTISGIPELHATPSASHTASTALDGIASPTRTTRRSKWSVAGSLDGHFIWLDDLFEARRSSI
ncbi:hypothetical protein BKA93DRAFT_752313 [Sparassis latifolia]